MAGADAAAGGATTLAIVVSPGVSAYLPRTLRGIADQHVAPQALVIVDTSAPGGHLGTGVPMHQAIHDAGLPSTTRVLHAPGARTFGHAVALALASSDGGTGTRPDSERPTGPGWLWLLHDDSAPDPAALGEQLHAADTGESIAIVGAKQRDWEQPDRLLEVGVRATRTARRVQDIDAREIDQGQLDHRDDMLAVGTAGALVRRSAWDELGGTDRALGPFGDGLDLSRRAWLAGHRVVVAPSAVVYHARASLNGLREGQARRGQDPDQPDLRRSFRERRRAQLHNWITSVPAPLVPLVGLLVLLLAVPRALWRLATKEIAMVVDELHAAADIIASPRAVWLARRRAHVTSRIAPRHLDTLWADGREVRKARREARRAQAAARSNTVAPSELEITERADLARRRRAAAGLTLVVLAGLGLVAFAPLLTAGALHGGALWPLETDLGGLWQAATSAWLAAGLGHGVPADPLGLVLAVLMTPLEAIGAGGNVLLIGLVVLALPLAGVGAWFASGAATRSVLLRAWATLVWAAAPTFLLASGQGRIGALLAHLALPWVALGVARALGVHRRDVILSGLVGAQRVREVVAPDAALNRADGADVDGVVDGVVDGDAADDAADGETVASTGAPPAATGRTDAGTDVLVSDEVATAHGTADVATADPPAAPEETATAAGEDEPDDDAERVAADDHGETLVEPPAPAGSIAAAAAAGLALAVATAGAPSLLLPALLALLVVAVLAPRRRRLLGLVALPPVVLFGPLLTSALGDLPGGSWRALLAAPGRAVATTGPEAWGALLGWPMALPDQLTDAFGAALGPVGSLLPLATGAVVVLLATLALLRGTTRARAVRAGWVVALLGLATALLSAHTVTGTGRDLHGQPALVTGWAGAGLSLLLLGLLAATLTAADGMRGWLTARSFGWRQLATALLVLLMVLAPLAGTGLWLTALRGGESPTLLAVEAEAAPAVPALARELQTSPQRSRVLALQPEGEAIRAEVWRHAGPQLTESATVLAATTVSGPTPTDAAPAAPDDATDALEGLVARLAAGATTTAGADLGDLAVGVVLVPPAQPGAEPMTLAARLDLITRLDATAGLEPVTENESGTIWRTSRADEEDAAAQSVARARVLDADGQVLRDVDAGVVSVRAGIPRGDEGRTVVLAERADAGWQATYDGHRLRSVSEGWRQGFELPARTGELHITYEPAWQLPWRIAQVIVLGLSVVLALPLRRRREVIT